MAEARARLADVPAEVVITNHVMGLYELAAIHLSATPPDLVQSALAIDAVACLVDGLGDRLGEEAPTMRDALNNIRLAFVQIKGAAGECGRSGRPIRPTEPTDGASRTRPSTTVTSSDRNSAACSPTSFARSWPERVDDPPPRHLDVGRRQDPTDEPRPLRIAGRLGDVAVRRDLPWPQRPDHVEDAPLPLVARSAVHRRRMSAAS